MKTLNEENLVEELNGLIHTAQLAKILGDENHDGVLAAVVIIAEEFGLTDKINFGIFTRKAKAGIEFRRELISGSI